MNNELKIKKGEGIIMKKFINIILSFGLITTMLTTSSLHNQLKAEENSTYVTEEQGVITIGNDYISRTMTSKGDHILTSSIRNKHADIQTLPQAGSEDFAIHLVNKQEVEAVEPTDDIDRSDWKASLTNKDGVEFTTDAVSKLFDGNVSTYIDDYQKAGQPFVLDIDLGTKQLVTSFSVDKRPGYSDPAYGTNGTMGKFELYVSDDKANWKAAGKGEFTKDSYGLHQVGDLYNVGNRVFANFDQSYTTRYVRIIQVSTALGTASEFTSSEIHLFEDAYVNANDADEKNNMILSSELVYDTHNVDQLDDGEKLTISYAPILKNDITYTIDQVFVIKGDDHYMRSFIEIEASDEANAQIDYIDTDRFVLTDDAQGVWSRPEDNSVSSMWIGKHELMLGQPIYVNGLFMGSEFPAADTIIDDQITQIRYYSGKTFQRLKEDNQLTKDGKFVSWQNVIGAAEGVDSSVVQTSFFEYIEEIATPTEFRKQYNSWYDNMMDITDDSIATSFLGAEAGLSKEGIEPLDSYVVDDGWNNYYDGKYTSNPGSSQGTTPNQTGFWEFNAKFPNELYTSSALSNKLQSSFGLWVGPQGGYNYFNTFGQFIEASGTGYAQNDYWQNVCVGSDKYVNNLETLFIDYQKRFDIDYWKWDGFALRPCSNASHGHMTGGTSNMYYTTDLWEKWTDLFENVREARASEGKGLWINATCYVNLSPWLLQWVNTVWLQDSGDTGQAGTGARHEQKIYYRDNVYYNLYKKNEVQFPLKNIYNHDPIYGVSDGSSATTEEFRQYLFANAVRGTAFWELYFSPSIFDEAKWKVAADALSFAETNFDVLKNAKMFGNVPTEGVYGYSSWNNNEGIISFTNPLDIEQIYSLTVNDTIGAPKTLKDAKGIQVLPYEVGVLDTTLSFGDEVTVTLAPHETKIFHYNHEDTTAPTIISASNSDNQHIRLKFSERISADGEYIVNGIHVAAKLLDDYCSVELTTATPLTAGTINVQLNNIHDVYGNIVTDKTINFQAYHNGVIADLSKIDDFSIDTVTGNDYVNLQGSQFYLTKKGMQGDGSFAISFTLTSTSENAVILKQGDNILLQIDKDGYLNVQIKDQILSTKETVTTVREKAHGLFNTEAYVPTKSEQTVTGKINDGKSHSITFSKEVNGMLKLYVDGILSNSAYDVSKNGSILMDSVILGSTNLDGAISDLQMVNHSIDYNEAKRLSDKVLGVDSMKAVNRDAWNATACSEMPEAIGDSNAMAAIDSNLATWWHTNYVGGDNHEGHHFIEVDFQDQISFDEIHYTGRGGSNGDVSKYNLFAKQNGQWVNVISKGIFDSNSAVNIIELDSTVTAEGLRFELLETINGYGAAKEIEVFTYDQDITFDDVDAVYKELKQTFDMMDENAFTVDSFATYKNGFNKFNAYFTAVKDGGNSTKFVLEKMQAQVTRAYDQLVINNPTANKDVLQAVYDLCLAVENIGYSKDSWNAFMDAMKQAERVLADEQVTQEAINKTTEELNYAYENLREDTELTKSILKSVIDKAKSYDNAGKLDHLAVNVTAMIRYHLAEANMIYQNADATNEECLTAWLNLANALQYMDFIANKSDLKVLIDLCEEIDTSEYYGGVEEFIDALLNANLVYDNENVLQETIDAAYHNLQTAKDGLVQNHVNKELLRALLNYIDEIVGDGSNYKQDNAWTLFQQARTVAKNILANENATQAELDNAYLQLANTFEDIRLLPNEALLKQFHDFLAIVNENDMAMYQDEDVAFVMAVKANVVRLLNDLNSITDEDISETQNDVAIAIDILRNNKQDMSIPEKTIPSDQVNNVKKPVDHSTESDMEANLSTKYDMPTTGDMTNTIGISSLIVMSTFVIIRLRKSKK